MTRQGHRARLLSCMALSAAVAATPALGGDADLADATERQNMLAAALDPDVTALKELLAAGVDPNAAVEGITPLSQAVRFGPLPAVEALLDADADVNGSTSYGRTPLMFAVFRSEPALADLLLARGAAVRATDADGWSALMLAVRHGRGWFVERLLVAGADPDRASRLGWTPLMFAASKGREGVVQRLLDAGADPDARTLAGGTALIQALRNQRLSVIRLLLDAGADPDRDGAGATPTWWAASLDFADAIDALAARGADVERASPSALTPLMIAAREGHLAAVEALVRHGASITATDHAGRDAAALARQCGAGHVVAYLEALGRPAVQGPRR